MLFEAPRTFPWTKGREHHPLMLLNSPLGGGLASASQLHDLLTFLSFHVSGAAHLLTSFIQSAAGNFVEPYQIYSIYNKIIVLQDARPPPYVRNERSRHTATWCRSLSLHDHIGRPISRWSTTSSACLLVISDPCL